VSVTYISHHEAEYRYKTESAAEDASALKSVFYNTLKVIPKGKIIKRRVKVENQ